jgi:hypothetical protein
VQLIQLLGCYVREGSAVKALCSRTWTYQLRVEL